NLQNVRANILERIKFGVANSRSRRHMLNFSGIDRALGPERVLMFEGALDDVSDNLHVLMRVSGKSLAGRDAVLVDHTQNAKTHKSRIIIVGERKRVKRIQPAMHSMTAFGGFAHL